MLTRVLRRSLASPAKFLTPEQLVQKRADERENSAAFVASLRLHKEEYAPKTLGEDSVNAKTGRPVPLNVRLLQYKPMQLPQTHGVRVATVDFRGYDESELFRAGEFAARAAYFLGIPCKRLKKLKTEKRLYTVIRSPFAQAKSKENFHRITYNRRLEAFDANAELVDLWLSYINKHAIDKVEYSVKIFAHEPLDFAAKLDTAEMALPEEYASGEDPVGQKVAELLQSESFKKHLE